MLGSNFLIIRGIVGILVGVLAVSLPARMIVRQGGVVAVVGVAIGLAAALAGSRLIESLLYDVSPRDPGVFLTTTLTLLAVALVACWRLRAGRHVSVPSRRCGRNKKEDAGSLPMARGYNLRDVGRLAPRSLACQV
jgi:hypothetical protein